MTDKRKDPGRFELALVMPVYNEAECIAAVIEKWHAALKACTSSFVMIILNDGSKDDTEQRLEAFWGRPDFAIVNKSNSGHGPTILQGYDLACEAADWVFQTDSDDEMPPDTFAELWRARADHDLLLGVRANRRQNAARWVITRVSRLATRVLFGAGVHDVNTPYRLMRASALKPLLSLIPRDTFAPNVIISGLAARRGWRVFEWPVPYQGRKSGVVSIVRWKLWRAAFRAFRQTVTVARQAGATR